MSVVKKPVSDKVKGIAEQLRESEGELVALPYKQSAEVVSKAVDVLDKALNTIEVSGGAAFVESAVRLVYLLLQSVFDIGKQIGNNGKAIDAQREKVLGIEESLRKQMSNERIAEVKEQVKQMLDRRDVEVLKRSANVAPDQKAQSKQSGQSLAL